MHEVSLMQGTLDIAVARAQEAGASRIESLTMRIGALSGVVRDALEFAFEVLTPGTLAEGARLIIEDVPVVCYCPGCAAEFEPQGMVFGCPQCGERSAQVRRGREIDLVQMEVE